jgi:hypothetical protein
MWLPSVALLSDDVSSLLILGRQNLAMPAPRGEKFYHHAIVTLPGGVDRRPQRLRGQPYKTSTIRNGLHARPHRLRRPARVPLAPNAYVVSILMVTHDLAVPPPPWSASAG